MAGPRAKRFDYSLSLDRNGRATTGDASIDVPDAWAPEHLVLAGLTRCTLASLRYHARRAGVAVEAEASARAAVTRREEDGRYAFVEIECRLDVTLDPKPGEPEVTELLARAERDCFVGASLRPSPAYVWSVA
jgi:organic hydroperoxide reductase OsmC/OhrA